jgi:hypothetical protein
MCGGRGRPKKRKARVEKVRGLEYSTHEMRPKVRSATQSQDHES